MIRRTTKILLEIVALISAGLAILVVMAAVKLSSGPLSVGFLTPYLVGALEPEDGSFSVSIDDAVLTWVGPGDGPGGSLAGGPRGGWEQSLQVRAVGVKISDPAGATRAEIPEMTIGFSGRALMRAQLAPTRLEVVGPRLILVRDEDGSIKLTDTPPPVATDNAATDESPAASPTAPPTESNATAEAPAAASEERDAERTQVSSDFAADLLSDILSPPGPSNKMGYLRSLMVLDADVTLIDRQLGMRWRAPSSTFLLRKGVGGLQLRSNFGVEIGGETAEFSLDGEYDTEDEEITAELKLADIQPALFASQAPLFAMLEDIKMPLSGTLRLRAGFDGTVQVFALDVTGGSGTILFPGEPEDAAVPVNALRLRAQLTDDLTALQLDELQIDFGGPQVTATGSLQGVERGVVTGPFEAVAELAVQNLSVADLKKLWPSSAAANAHKWVVDNIHEGQVDDGKFALSGTAGDAGIESFEITDLSGGFRYRDMVLSYFDTLPRVQKGHGIATVHKDGISFAVAGGEVQGLTVDSAKVDITGFNAKDQDLAVEVVARGAIRNVLTILDHPRLNYVKGMGIKPTDVAGDTAVRLRLQLPLLESLTFKQVAIAAAAAMRGVGLPKAAFGLDVSQGDLTLQLDGRGMDVTGKALLGAIPLTIVWAENFLPKGYARQYKVQATVDDAGRRSMGLEFDEYLHGPVAVDATMTEYTNKANTLSLNADVTRSEIDLKTLLGWSKEPGIAGRFKAEMALTGYDLTAIKDFTLDSDGFIAKGALGFAADGKTISTVKLNQLRFNRTDVTGDIARRGDGGYDIALKGNSFDAAHFVKGDKDNKGTPPQGQAGQGQAGAAAAPPPDVVPLNIALTLSQLHLGDGGALGNVSARLQRNTKHWRVITVSGQPSADHYFTLNLLPDGANRRLQVRSDDAGSVFKILDISENIVGGQLQLTGLYDDSQPDGPLAGKLEATGFRLIKAPAIAKLLSVALLTGVLDSLRGEGIGFDRLDADFTIRKDVIESRNARAHGPALGLTAQGWISLASQTVGLRGTIVPAYAVNSILNNIPLIGPLLGGPGSGVFAATYRMTGSLDDPDISVNPLATLAPGFLRGLFGIFEGGTPKNPDAAPDPSTEQEPLPDPRRD